jgi:hypothetical protein
MDCLISIIKHNSWDSGKLSCLESGLSEGQIQTTGDVKEILSCFDWDDGKLKALKIIIDECPGDILKFRMKKELIKDVLDAFDWDDGKGKAAKVISSFFGTCKKPKIDPGVSAKVDVKQKHKKLPSMFQGSVSFDDGTTLRWITDSYFTKRGRSLTYGAGTVLWVNDVKWTMQEEGKAEIDFFIPEKPKRYSELYRMKDQVAEKDDPEITICALCMTNKRSVMQDCKHVCSCAGCLISMINSNQNGSIICPICKKEVETVSEFILS